MKKPAVKKPQANAGVLAHPQRVRFRRSLLEWYGRHRRELPWRENRDPYRVWISEIMLQQTRVAAVIEHYQEFLRRFPTVRKLAAARQASVLAAWSGLGYYRRARMLHAAAKVIVRKHDGKLPATQCELRVLPGIGRYSAAAIASIAFAEPAAVVDGNVERVLQRVSGRKLTGEEFWKAAGELLDGSRPGDFNQAMMELGATVCTPRAPGCLTCPVIELCMTRGEFQCASRTAVQKEREIHYALDRRNEGSREEKVFLVQRPLDASLMPGMWELPEISTGYGAAPLLTLKHSITLTDYTVRVWRAVVPLPDGQWIPARRLGQVALTGLTRKILRRAEIISNGRPISTDKPILG